MDGPSFDRFISAIIATPSRRRMLYFLAAARFGTFGAPGIATAKKRRAPRPNEFGCLEIGQPCAGVMPAVAPASPGKKPKKGKKGKSRCVAHDVGVCTQGQNSCVQGGGPATDCDPNTACNCYRTTGNSGFCGNGANLNFQCMECSRDKDCEDAGFPFGSACIRRTEPGCGCPPGDIPTACVVPCNLGWLRRFSCGSGRSVRRRGRAPRLIADARRGRRSP